MGKNAWKRIFLLKQLDDEEILNLLDIAKAGIGRFYDEGHYTWTRKSFEDIFEGKISVENELVQSSLKKWEKEGIIKLVGTDQCYIEVLKSF